MFNEYTIKDVIEEVIDYRGKTPKKLGGDWSEEKTEYMALSAKNIKKGRIVQPDTIRYVDQEMYNKWMKQEVERGTILITSEAPFGELLYWDSDEKIVLSQRLFGLKIKKEFNSRYIYYYMFSEQFQGELSGRATGSTVTGLRQPELLKCHLKIPNRKYQDIIANILMNIDKKIDLNSEINNNLYEEAVALYKDKFKGIGQGKKTIGDYIVPKRGKNLLTRDAIDGDIPVVAGGIAPSAYHNQFNTKSPVITISASGANAGYTNLWNIPVWASDCSYIDDSITKNVYFWYIILKTRQNEIFDAQTGSAQPHIYPQHIAEMSIGELNIAEVEKYNNLVAPLFKMIGENQKENKKLSQLRDTLLPKLMNGELDLDNIEI